MTSFEYMISVHLALDHDLLLTMDFQTFTMGPAKCGLLIKRTVLRKMLGWLVQRRNRRDIRQSISRN